METFVLERHVVTVTESAEPARDQDQMADISGGYAAWKTRNEDQLYDAFIDSGSYLEIGVDYELFVADRWVDACRAAGLPPDQALKDIALGEPSGPS